MSPVGPVQKPGPHSHSIYCNRRNRFDPWTAVKTGTQLLANSHQHHQAQQALGLQLYRYKYLKLATNELFYPTHPYRQQQLALQLGTRLSNLDSKPLARRPAQK
jgi:hypothetical protein